eukprot:gene25090-62811_t
MAAEACDVPSVGSRIVALKKKHGMVPGEVAVITGELKGRGGMAPLRGRRCVAAGGVGGLRVVDPMGRGVVRVPTSAALLSMLLEMERDRMLQAVRGPAATVPTNIGTRRNPRWSRTVPTNIPSGVNIPPGVKIPPGAAVQISPGGGASAAKGAVHHHVGALFDEHSRAHGATVPHPGGTVVRAELDSLLRLPAPDMGRSLPEEDGDRDRDRDRDGDRNRDREEDGIGGWHRVEDLSTQLHPRHHRAAVSVGGVAALAALQPARYAVRRDRGRALVALRRASGPVVTPVAVPGHPRDPSPSVPKHTVADTACGGCPLAEGALVARRVCPRPAWRLTLPGDSDDPLPISVVVTSVWW